MLNVFDMLGRETIQNFRSAFFEATGMLLSFADRDHRQYNTYYAGSRCEYCHMMNASVRGLDMCITCSREAGRRAASTGKPLIYKCHSGLSEIVVPIIINGEHHGSVYSGQVMSVQPTAELFQPVKERLEKEGLANEAIEKAYFNVPVISESRLELVVNLLCIMVDYFVESEVNAVLKEHIREEKDRLDQVVPYIRNEIFNDIIHNETHKLAGLDKRVHALGLTQTPNAVLVGKLDGYADFMKSREKKDELQIRYMIMEALSRQFSDSSDRLFHVLEDGRFMALLHIRAHPDEGFRRKHSLAMAEHIRMVIFSKTMFTSIIGVGRVYDDTLHLGTSYIEANNAQIHGKLLGRNQIIHIDDIVVRNEEPVVYRFNYRELINRIILLDENGAVDVLDGMFRDFFLLNENDVNKVKAFGMELLNEILDSVVHGETGTDVHADKIEYFHKLIQLGTVPEIYEWEKATVMAVIGLVRESRNQRDRTIIRKALDFIEENHSRDINIDDVAAAVFLSPNYFGWVFKKEMKMTYVEYLTGLRMEKAKELLKNTDSSIQMIAEKVGYDYANYFSQVFKKHTGLNPSVYRKSKET